jgi:hypothetical protein
VPARRPARRGLAGGAVWATPGVGAAGVASRWSGPMPLGTRPRPTTRCAVSTFGREVIRGPAKTRRDTGAAAEAWLGAGDGTVLRGPGEPAEGRGGLINMVPVAVPAVRQHHSGTSSAVWAVAPTPRSARSWSPSEQPAAPVRAPVPRIVAGRRSSGRMAANERPAAQRCLAGRRDGGEIGVGGTESHRMTDMRRQQGERAAIIGRSYTDHTTAIGQPQGRPREPLWCASAGRVVALGAP